MSFSQSRYQIPPSARIILRRNGIPPAVAVTLLEESKSVMCSIRGNDSGKLPSEQRLRAPSCPKRGSIQAKSCEIGPASSFVTVDPDFAKATLDSQGRLIPTPRKKGDLPDDQPALILKASLQETIARIESNEYTLVEAEEGRLIFKVSSNTEIPDLIKDTLYEINLNPKNGIPPETIEDLEAIGLEKAFTLEKPTWWDNNELGNYDIVANYSFQVQYKKSDIDVMKDFMIAGDTYNGKVLPVIGDLDQFILAFNKNYLDGIIEKLPACNQEIFAMPKDKDNVMRLQDERFNLEKYLLEKEMQKTRNFNPATNFQYREKLQKIQDKLDKQEFVKGVITPLESYYSDSMNDKFARDIPHIRNFFQHASEARNPYEPSKIGTIVFFINGTIHEIKGPENVAKFLLNEVLPDFKFDIHYGWDMKYFAPVIEKQKELGHRILEKTELSYQYWKKSQEISPTRSQIIKPPEDEYTRLREKSANNKETETNTHKNQQNEVPSQSMSKKL